jgi:hypothetical protein
MNCGDDECMTEKTENKEFAYFSGITTGRNGERKRILDALRDLHIEKRQLAHINSPSGVCGTCRAVAIVEGKKS